MITELTDEALAFGDLAKQALESAGGDELVQRAEIDPQGRAGLVGPALETLGAWDLDPRASTDELEAAAALCRSAGWWAVPYPVAARLSRLPQSDVEGVVVVSDAGAAGCVDGLAGPWEAVFVDGRSLRATALPAAAPPRKSAFVAPLELGDETGVRSSIDVALALALPSWTLLGMLDRAMALTCDYVRDREQFGQPLATFQGVQFQLTDAEVERAGVEELAKYALWSIEVDAEDALGDALALRLAAVEAADVVFRITHQLHGAIGFCDESPLSWLSRHSQPLRRLPFGISGTRGELTRHLGRRGLTGLFDAQGAAR